MTGKKQPPVPRQAVKPMRVVDRERSCERRRQVPNRRTPAIREMVSPIDVDHLSGDTTAQWAHQEHSRVADLALLRRPPERSEQAMVVDHFADPGDTPGGQGLDRSGRTAFTRIFLGPRSWAR